MTIIISPAAPEGNIERKQYHYSLYLKLIVWILFACRVVYRISEKKNWMHISKKWKFMIHTIKRILPIVVLASKMFVINVEIHPK